MLNHLVSLHVWLYIQRNVFFVSLMLIFRRLNTCRNLAAWKGWSTLFALRKWLLSIKEILKDHLWGWCCLGFFISFTAGVILLELPSWCNLPYLIDLNIFIKEFNRLTHLGSCHTQKCCRCTWLKVLLLDIWLLRKLILLICVPDCAWGIRTCAALPFIFLDFWNLIFEPTFVYMFLWLKYKRILFRLSPDRSSHYCIALFVKSHHHLGAGQCGGQIPFGNGLLIPL